MLHVLIQLDPLSKRRLHCVVPRRRAPTAHLLLVPSLRLAAARRARVRPGVGEGLQRRQQHAQADGLVLRRPGGQPLQQRRHLRQVGKGGWRQCAVGGGLHLKKGERASPATGKRGSGSLASRFQRHQMIINDVQKIGDANKRRTVCSLSAASARSKAISQ